MRSLMVIVMHKLFNTTPNDRPTDHPQRMEAVDEIFERMKLRFDHILICVFKPTVKRNSKESDLIAVVLGEKHSPRKVVYLG